MSLDLAVLRRKFFVEAFEELLDNSRDCDEEQLEWAQARLEEMKTQFELDRENEVENYMNKTQDLLIMRSEDKMHRGINEMRSQEMKLLGGITRKALDEAKASVKLEAAAEQTRATEECERALVKKRHYESVSDLTDKERARARRDGKRLANAEIRKRVTLMAAPIREAALEKVQLRVAQKRMALEQETHADSEVAAEKVIAIQ